MSVRRLLEGGPIVRTGEHPGHDAGAGVVAGPEITGGVAGNGHAADITHLEADDGRENHVRPRSASPGITRRQHEVSDVLPTEAADNGVACPGGETRRQTHLHPSPPERPD